MSKFSIAIVLLAFVGLACEEEETPSYEYYIEGLVNNRFLKYPQYNVPGTNVSNTYSPEFQETWLQGYGDSLDSNQGYWYVRIHDTDITTIKPPYQLDKEQGSIQWFDLRVDNTIENNPDCQGIDSGCSYSFWVGEGDNTMTITSVEDSVIEGRFSGKLILSGTGFSRFRDTTSSYTVEQGQFRIRYRTTLI